MMALVTAVVVTLSGDAMAHRIGLSRGEYLVSDGSVQSRIVLSHDELRDALPGLDGNEDGRLDKAELLRQTGLLQNAIVKGIELEVGGAECPGRVESAAPVEADGVAIVARHDCKSVEGDVRLNIAFLGMLSHGHRHVAELRANDAVNAIVAYEGNTAFRFDDAGQSARRAVTATATGRSPGAAPREASTPHAWEYLRLGIEHILLGIDHLLFVLGLAMAASSRRALLVAVTAFTVAHSVTLCLSSVGVVAVSPDWVEPLIAASIAYVGLENLLSKNVSMRWRLTFCFGLIHGFGFAGALREIGLPKEDLFWPLALFNVGVELGQLIALAAVVPILYWIRRRPLVAVPLAHTVNAALVAAGVCWCAVRLIPVVRAADGSPEAALARPASPPVREPAPLIAGQSARRAATANETGPGEETTTLVSVYPSSSEAVSPEVEQLCRAFHELPRARRAECGATTPGITLTRECERTLGAAVRSNAVRVAQSELGGCLAEWARRYEGCDWIERPSLPAVAACQNVLPGTLGEGASCRSALECEAGLFCHGVGPMDTGVCGKPRKAGSPCGQATDPLAGYVNAAAAPRRECEGACVRYRCQEGGALGQ